VVVIGAGRVGHVLARAGGRLVRRGEPIPEGDPPVVVCTRNDDVDGVIAATPAVARPDLVFVQNGVLRPVLARWGLEDVTHGVLWFAAADRSGVAIAGPPSWFWGRHAEAMIAALARVGLPARLLPDRAALDRAIAAKLLWNVVYGLLAEVHGVRVGAVPEAEVEALVQELAPVLGVPPDAEPLIAYTRSIPDFPGGLKEWEWRNGWVRARARERGLATPLHDGWLARLGR